MNRKKNELKEKLLATEAGVEVISRIDTDLATILIRSDGIMHTHMNVEFEISLLDATSIYKTSVETGKGKPFLNLFTTHHFAIPNSEVRSFMISEKRLAVTLADAFLINSLAQKLVGNFYMKVHSPPIPTRLFTDKKEAVKWLQNIKV